MRLYSLSSVAMHASSRGRRTPTRLGRLLQARRESAGYSRARLAELVGVPGGTIEGWETGRVAKPPVHDVLRVARVLRVPVLEIEAAALDLPGGSAARSPRDESPSEAASLLEQAIDLFGWSERQAAAALETSVPRVRAWRRGARAMALPEVMTVAALLALRAAGGAARPGERLDPTGPFPTAAPRVGPSRSDR
jgi:transcriptional regulator with XRE-family HTH domain